MYHRVRRATYDPWRLSVTPERFEAHLSLLARHKVVPLRDLPHSPGAIAITFDDGYADNLEIALPLLAKHSIPATIFIATDAFAGREFWWDRIEHAFEPGLVGRQGIGSVFHTLEERRLLQRCGRRLRATAPEHLEGTLLELNRIVPQAPQPACSRHRMMSRSDVCEIAASPLIDIGAHTRSHPCLPRLPEHQQLEEMSTSREILENLVGRRVATFAYPYGAHDDTSVDAAKRAGFDLACIVGGGLVRTTTDPFRLPRLMVRNLPKTAFAAQLQLWRAMRWLA